jgi:hypothetical protein
MYEDHTASLRSYLSASTAPSRCPVYRNVRSIFHCPLSPHVRTETMEEPIFFFLSQIQESIYACHTTAVFISSDFHSPVGLLLAWSMQGDQGRSPSMAALLPIFTDAHDSADERPPAAPAGKRKVPAHRREQRRNKGRATTATRPQRDVGSPHAAQP